ncbi:hypothetical protein ANN_02716 [Periplaneta americana]|uniref:Uncharacterized protein n=1 Tax=Periplaneta americana TaxID=6978 RepID=A0ABQ8TX40_PERAM|nr:hypothetical protein ANN_02716 [Periplaneta americana]
MAGLCEGGNEPLGFLKASNVAWIRHPQHNPQFRRRAPRHSIGLHLPVRDLDLRNEQAKVWGIPNQFSDPEMSASGVHAHCGKNVLVCHHA